MRRRIRDEERRLAALDQDIREARHDRRRALHVLDEIEQDLDDLMQERHRFEPPPRLRDREPARAAVMRRRPTTASL